METLRKLFEGKEKERQSILIIIFIIGLLLISFAPKMLHKDDVVTSNDNLLDISSTVVTTNEYERDLENRLSSILSKVEGAGEVLVMVTTSKSSEIVVSENIEQMSNTIMETDSNNGVRETEQTTTKKSTQVLGQNEKPLVITELVPEISGVIIVSEGANDVVVKDALIRSVSTILEIPSYKVQVLQKN